MAAATTAAQAELISSLAQDEIPIKLRCATCSRLAVNAFRLPCCDQAICETCQSTLPSSCPVCEHTPVAAEDCKPNKSLRTTIKVFLRTEEKKREALRVKEVKNTPPGTPHDVEPTPAEVIPEEASVTAPEAVASTPEADTEPRSVDKPVEEPVAHTAETEEAREAQQDIPQPSIEEIAPGQEQTETDADADANAAEDTSMDNEDGSKDMVPKDSSGQQLDAQGMPGFGAGFGFDPSATGGFPNMGFGGGGDFNQMQMMMAMQNGMAPNAFGNFPMMGMPGMNMDPMTMQNMFMNGGFGATGMGMNGMNMGMGMGGFEGVNGGFNNGWNQQQSWNVAPDNFNHPNAAAGMGHGDYGANNSGFSQHAAGYTQGNYGHGNQYNNYGNQGYQARGRGRGRGGFNQGRGGYGYNQNDPHSQQFPQQFGQGQGQQSNGPISETGSIPIGPKADTVPAGNVDEFGREIRPSSEAKEEKPLEPERTKEDGTPVPDNGNTTENANGNEVSQAGPQEGQSIPAEAGDIYPKPIQTLDEAQAASFHAPNGPSGFNPMSPLDPNGRGFGPARGGFTHNYRGRGGGFLMQPPPVKAVPINAPTGPKAMREGLPNTGLSSLRGRGFSIVGRASSRPVNEGSVAIEPESKEKERSRSISRETDRSKSRERRRDREREERHKHKHRHRSSSLSEDERESERRRERRRERRSRRYEEGDEEYNLGKDNEDGERVVDDRDSRRNGEGDDDARTRSASPVERSSHRSRRDRDKDRHREKDRGSDKDREHKSSSHKHHSSHRSHRDDRSRSRDRDRDREHRHSRRRESRRGSPDLENKVDDLATPAEPITEPEVPSRKPSTAVSINGIEIKGTSSRKAAEEKAIYIPTGPSKDRASGSSTRDREREKERSSRHHDEKHRSSRHRESERSSAREREREREREKEKPRGPPTGPAADPHTLEREARNRERLLKEAQRIAGLTAAVGMGGQKRSRDEGDDGLGRKGKKKGRRSGVVDENEEARLARLEAERESARWG